VGALIILSNRIIRPFSRNLEKQKMFITDASHELKTPLTIINTNVDILEMEYGENESFNDIHNQIDKLKDLTNNLVLLTKIEESKSSINLIDQPISDILIESIAPFKNLAITQNKNIESNIQEMLSMKCDDKSMRQLVNILLENALKYSKENTTINISFKKVHSNLIFEITNESLYELNKDSLKYIFDRFYRPDASRNSSTGGHGIGLSIAKAIVNSHNSKIQANIIENNKFQIIVTFTT
jgi:signal transduction histidine kinase